MICNLGMTDIITEEHQDKKRFITNRMFSMLLIKENSNSVSF